LSLFFMDELFKFHNKSNIKAIRYSSSYFIYTNNQSQI
jgi:hypothetical protein